MSSLPFSYFDLVSAAIIKSATDQFPEGAEVAIEVTKQNIISRLGLSKDDITNASDFCEWMSYTYRGLNLHYTMVSHILDNPNYFPENHVHFVAEMNSGTASKINLEHFTEEEVNLHKCLFRFWKQYSAHFNTQMAILHLCSSFGAVNVRLNQGEDMPYYHRGNEYDNGATWAPTLSVMFKIYDDFVSEWGFSPAMPIPYFDYESLPDLMNLFCFGNAHEKGFNAYVPTLAGIIIFAGSVNSVAGQQRLKAV